MSRIKEYPSWACAPCGKEHGASKGKLVHIVATFHYGKCDVCGKNAEVTQPRDYGHFPNWFNRSKK